jgi:hypothetical protein
MTREKTLIQFDPSAFSSRKLLEVASSGAITDDVVQTQPVDSADIPANAAVNELARRGHYLTELVDRGLISAH